MIWVSNSGWYTGFCYGRGLWLRAGHNSIWGVPYVFDDFGNLTQVTV